MFGCNYDKLMIRYTNYFNSNQTCVSNNCITLSIHRLTLRSLSRCVSTQICPDLDKFTNSFSVETNQVVGAKGKRSKILTIGRITNWKWGRAVKIIQNLS